MKVILTIEKKFIGDDGSVSDFSKFCFDLSREPALALTHIEQTERGVREYLSGALTERKA